MRKLSSLEGGGPRSAGGAGPSPRARSNYTSNDSNIIIITGLVMIIVIYIYIYYYIYIYIYSPRARSWRRAAPRPRCRRRPLGATDCTPNTSEIVMDCQLRCPLDVQWHVPMDLHCSVACSKGLSFPQWILPEIANGLSVAVSNEM